ncbi:MAG: arginyltransferase [Proteobacteria bacterium]|nr:arginyltransferase [Pseudomonadota bacterium]
MSQQTTTPPLYLSIPQDCSYLPGRQSQMLFIDPEYPITPALYDQLLAMGFRRSGRLIYRPHCPHCGACVAVRIPTSDFTPARGQKRTLKKNADLTITVTPPHINDELFDLYRRYQAQRHPGAGMDNPTHDSFTDFLIQSPVQSLFVEFREPREDRLVSVAVLDQQPDSLSAVYTFYDPEADSRGLGTLAVLWQIQHALSESRPWVYLGYWIDECEKMSYKKQFRPLETFSDTGWTRLREK